MKLLDAYRIALVEGLTAKQAGIKFNMNHASIAKCKTRYNLPTLKNEWESGYEERMNKFNDSQLLSYYKALINHKYGQNIRELNVCKMLVERRKLCPR